MSIKEIRRGFNLKEKDGVKFLTIPSFEETGEIICAFSTRIGGVSPKPFDTLSFSLKREQSSENFIENMRRFAGAVGFDYKNAVAINYAHSNRLHRAQKIDAGCGIIKKVVTEVCDGLYTDVTGLPLMSYHADCLPLFFYDRRRKAAAVCHAGWRGIASHITINAVASLVSMGGDAGDIIAAIGPCISAPNYEIGEDVSDLLLREFGEGSVIDVNGKSHADLAFACAKDMQKAGIPPRNITVSDMCTYRDKDLFFSHRRDNGKTGAMAAVIELKG